MSKRDQLRFYDWRQIQTFNAQRLVHDSDCVYKVYALVGLCLIESDDVNEYAEH